MNVNKFRFDATGCSNCLHTGCYKFDALALLSKKLDNAFF